MLSQIELEAAPKVTLAGKEYPVPMLVPRQQRIVVPLLMSLMKTMASAVIIDGVKVEKIDPTKVMTTELFDDLVNLVFVGLSRGSPSLTRDDFMDLETNIIELIAAMNVIAAQTGVMKRAVPGAAPVVDGAVAGEATAGSSTGTASSPA